MLSVISCRITGNKRAGFDITKDTGSTCYHGAGTDRDMVLYPGLAGDDHSVAYLDASGDTYLPHDDTVFSDAVVVRDLNQVVYLSAPSDGRHAGACSVYGGVCADLNIVTQKNPTDLRYLVMGVPDLGVPEAVCADYTAAVEDYPIPEDDVAVD